MITVGIDLGSSYVDLAFNTGAVITHSKIPVGNQSSSDAILTALDQACTFRNINPADIDEVRIGSTGAVNMLLKREGARVGLLTNKGFGDTLALARQNRADLYDPIARSLSPTFLVADGCIREISGRLDAQGVELEPLFEGQIREEVASLIDAGVEAIVVCLLFAHISPAQELACAKIIAEYAPEIDVVLSHQVDNAAREYERTVSTCLEAWLRPWHLKTLAALELGLAERQFQGQLFMADSCGHLLDIQCARELAINQVASGPAAAALNAAQLATAQHIDIAVMMDIGSVSTDIVLIEDGKPASNSNAVFVDVPLRKNMTDVASIAIGGKSMVSGAEAATLSDACAVLQALTSTEFPDAFQRIEQDSALKGQTSLAFAQTIRADAADIISAAMLKYCVSHNVDPAAVTLIVSGGLGKTMGPVVGERLGVSRIIASKASQVSGALGLLTARPIHEAILNIRSDIAALSDETLQELLLNKAANTRHFYEHWQMEVAPDAYMHPVRIDVNASEIHINGLKQAYRQYYCNRFASEPRSAGYLFSIVYQQLAKAPKLGKLIESYTNPLFQMDRKEWVEAEEDGIVVLDRSREKDSALTPVRPRTLQMRLDAIAQGMQQTLFRTAVSPVVREGNDAAAALLSPTGEIAALSDAIPLLLGALGGSLQAILEIFPADKMKEGELFFMNDPYRGGTHLPDITVVLPVFYKEKLVAFTATMLHHQDIGGMRAGSVAPDAVDIFQEGLRLPPMQMGEDRRIGQAAEALIRCNSRMPETVLGDLSSQIAALVQAERALHRLIREIGQELFQNGVEQCLALGEEQARRFIASIPSGPFYAEEMLDPTPGLPDVKVKLKLSSENSVFKVDFTGSTEQVAAPINCVRSGPFAATFYSLLSAMSPISFRNGGVVRCLEFILPDGSAMNASMPAAVNARTGIVRAITSTLLQALAQALPASMPAANSGMSYVLAFSGRDANGTAFVSTEIIAGGAGGGPDRDGQSGISTDVGNAMNMPGEALEAMVPIRLVSAEIKRGSGGEGRFRGGDAISRIYLALQDKISVSLRGERFKTVPPGVLGGQPPSPAFAAVKRKNGDLEILATRSTPTLNEGDQLIVESCGGAGYGCAD